jgi:hypothetical protein
MTQATASSSAASTAAALEQHLVGLESVCIDHAAVHINTWLASLKASYANRDAEYSRRIAELEAPTPMS